MGRNTKENTREELCRCRVLEKMKEEAERLGGKGIAGLTAGCTVLEGVPCYEDKFF